MLRAIGAVLAGYAVMFVLVFLTFSGLYLALGAEISTDYHERTLLASARTNLGWFVGVVVAASALALIFTPEGGLDGRFVISHYQSYGILSAVGVIIASCICIGGTGSLSSSRAALDTKGT